MTEITNTRSKTGSYKVDRTKFGGIISFSDFYANYPLYEKSSNGSHIAQRIRTDENFDNKCKKNYESRERRSKS